MLTTPDDLLFLYMLRHDTQNELFRHLSRDGGICVRAAQEQHWILRVKCQTSTLKGVQYLMSRYMYA